MKVSIDLPVDVLDEIVQERLVQAYEDCLYIGQSDNLEYLVQTIKSFSTPEQWESFIKKYPDAIMEDVDTSEIVRTDLIDMYNNLTLDCPEDYELLNALAVTIQFYSTQKQWFEFVLAE